LPELKLRLPCFLCGSRAPERNEKG
jgi:hypothetical protein